MLCCVVLRGTVTLFHHINANHISYRNFPDIGFLEFHNRLCSECGFAYEKCFSFCQCSLGPGLLSVVLAKELRHAYANGCFDFLAFSCWLRLPKSSSGWQKRYDVKEILSSRRQC